MGIACKVAVIKCGIVFACIKVPFVIGLAIHYFATAK